MQAMMSHILLMLNRAGTLFWNQAAGIFLQSPGMVRKHHAAEDS